MAKKTVQETPANGLKTDDVFDFEPGDAREGGSDPKTPSMPAPDPDDFFSPENMRLATALVPTPKSVTSAYELGKPPKDGYFRVHPNPEFSAVYPCVEKDETLFIIHPRLATQVLADPKLESSVKYVRLVFCATYNGPFFVWPINVPRDQTNVSAIYTAQDQAVTFAMEGWIRMTWAAKKKIHESFPYVGPAVPDPDWPDKSFSEILKVVFGSGQMIATLDHPTLRKLAGLEM